MMASDHVAAVGQAPAVILIQRKAVGRKAVGTGLARSSSSSTASTSPSIASHHHHHHHHPALHDGTHRALPAATQEPAGYFGTDPRLNAPAPHNKCVVSPQQTSSQPAVPAELTRTLTGTSSCTSGSSQWPTSPGSTVSYRTDITTPMSHMTANDGQWASASPAPVASSVGYSPSVPLTAGPTCAQCRAMIQPNVSVFDCLICSSGGVATRFCVYCYTSGAASAGHSQHNPSFYVSDSDLLVEPPQETGSASKIAPVPAHIWICRKSATGRLWYQHRATGYRTHLRPCLATVPPPALPLGWQRQTTPDGKTYYCNPKTGVTTWTAPMPKPLPAGWIELRTPDCVPFYMHQEHQLTCWERPGEPPSTYSRSKEGKSTRSSTSSSKFAHGVAAGSAAVTLAGSLASICDAAELSPQGIISATVAAAKFTHLGAKVAGRKMKLDKLANSKQMRRASKLFTHASKLAIIGDEDGFEGGDDCETQYEEDTGSTEGYAPGYEASVASEQNAYEPQYVESYQQPTTEFVQQEPVYEPAVPLYEPAVPVCEPVVPVYEPVIPLYEQATPVPSSYPPGTVLQPQVIDEAPQQQYYEPPTTDPSSTCIVESVLCSEANVEPAYAGPASPTLIPNETTFAYSEPPIVCPVELSTGQVYGASLPPLTDSIPLSMPPAAVCMSEIGPIMPAQDGAVPLLVFDPVLAGPMIVSPPTEQGGVVFAPTDASHLI